MSFLIQSPPKVAIFDSGEFSYTNGSDTTFNHLLGAKPRFVQVSLICKVAANGFSVGDEVYTQGAAGYGWTGQTAYANATTITVMVSNAAMLIQNSDNAGKTISPVNWNLRVRAYL